MDAVASVPNCIILSKHILMARACFHRPAWPQKMLHCCACAVAAVAWTLVRSMLGRIVGNTCLESCAGFDLACKQAHPVIDIGALSTLVLHASLKDLCFAKQWQQRDYEAAQPHASGRPVSQHMCTTNTLGAHDFKTAQKTWCFFPT